MRTIILFLLLIAYYHSTTAQNLVPNNSFESYTQPPNDIAQVCRATGWSSPSELCSSGNGGTPDFFHTAGSGVVDPPDIAWATLSPHTGGGMEGFGTYYFVPVDWREYLQCQLTAPLLVGETYEVSFWLCNGGNSILTIGTNNIGIAFTNSPLTQNITSPIAVTPQVEVTQVVYSSSWQYFSFVYTATAPFQYICIGNFRNDAGTIIQPQTSNANSGAYYYIDDIVVQPLLVLPVELIEFNVEMQDESTVMLEWETSSEISSDYFSVERSVDGVQFTEIGKVDATGSSLVNHDYHFADTNPHTGINYYRLRKVDVDGVYSFSAVKSVEIIPGDSFSIFIYPNPVPFGGSIILEVTGMLSNEIKLLDAMGRVCRQLPQPLIEGYQKISFDLGVLPRGIYFMQTK